MKKIITCGVLFFLSLLLCASLAETSINGEALNVKYFIPETGCHLYYASSHNGDSYAVYDITWEEAGPGKYKRVCCNADQSTDYDIYQLAAGKVLRLESGFAIPYSEYVAEVIIEGEDIVSVYQKPRFSWSSTYVTKDSWHNICRTTTNREFTGYEKINVLGRETIAAKIVIDSKIEMLNEEEFAGWGNVSVTQKSEAWYAEGIGLVKKITHTDTGAGIDVFDVYLTQAFDQNGNNLK